MRCTVYVYKLFGVHAIRGVNMIQTQIRADNWSIQLRGNI